MFVPERVNLLIMVYENKNYKAITLSEFIKGKRKDLNLTQQDLAEKAGVGLRFVRELERDKPPLQINKVNQVLMLFGHELAPVPMNREKLIKYI